MVDNLLNSDDVHYMLGALRTLGLRVAEDKAIKRAIVEGCGGLFPVGKESREEIQLFLGNAGTAMRPLTAAVTAAGGNSRYVCFFFLNKIVLEIRNSCPTLLLCSLYKIWLLLSHYTYFS